MIINQHAHQPVLNNEKNTYVAYIIYYEIADYLNNKKMCNLDKIRRPEQYNICISDRLECMLYYKNLVNREHILNHLEYYLKRGCRVTSTIKYGSIFSKFNDNQIIDEVINTIIRDL